MQKISVTAPKTQLEDVVESLHDLGLLHIEEYDGDLETGEPFERGEELSELLVDVRSLLSKLPEPDTETKETISVNELQENLPELAEQVNNTKEKLEALKSKEKGLKDEKKYFKQFKGLDLEHEDFEGTKNLEVWIGRIDTKKLDKNTEDSRYEIIEGEKNTAILYEKQNNDLEDKIKEYSKKTTEIRTTERKGTANEIIRQLEKEIREIKSEKKQLEEDLKQISEEEYGRLEHVEEFLTEEIEKIEAPLKFATTDKAFIVEGWIPKDKYEELEEQLIEKTDSKVHIQQEEGGTPPIKQENNRIVEPFESLTNLMAVPRYGEIDPSFMIFLTFPLMFGFMIGDAGYGLTSAIVFYAGMKMFPAAEGIFKSLLWCSAATIFFGLIYGDVFGFIIFGPDNALTAATGITFFESIPVIYHRVDYLGEVFLMAAAIGVAHVNIGLLIGAYNEYIRHGVLAAILEKGSWILLQIAAVTWYFYGSTVGAPIVALSLIMLYKGEGIEGLVEIPSLISNILSYLRLFGVSVAAISLAQTANSIASPAFASGTLLGFIVGTLILIVGHTFNTFIKIMEGFLQGIRLHYVELFNWFYEGGGTEYNPFGKTKQY